MRQRGRNIQRQRKVLKQQMVEKLIMQDGRQVIKDFYDSLDSLKGRVMIANISIAEKEQVNDLYKEKFSNFRKSFVDGLLAVDKRFGRDVLKTMDELLNVITDAIFDNNEQLNVPEKYEKSIGSRIQDSKGKLIKLLCSYEG